MNKMTHNGPIFVVGAPRSGTTLLQRMLRSHPRISSPTGESHFFIPLLRDEARYGDLSRVENVRLLLEQMHGLWAEFLDTDFHGVRFEVDAMARAIHARGATRMSDILDALFRINAEGEGKTRWLDKTPYYIHHIPTLLAAYPDAQVVHIIRDGRDAALSMLERAADIRVFNTDACARLWKRYVESGQGAGKQLAPHQYFELRYEDILREPGASVRGLCAFLGEEFSEKVIDFQKSRDPKTKTPLLKQGLQESNREKWRSSMTPRQIRTFESIAGDTLRTCGYELAYPMRPLNLLDRSINEIHQRVMARLNPHPKDPRFKR
ncbi:MAG: sulfotransferase [Thiobacillus sp.]|nr:sulfotransferase [Thiobacillus sp.]